MQYVFLSFLAGILTVLAPCALPVLPVILGGTLENTKDRLRPLIITASLGISVFTFTLLLKVSTAFIYVDPQFWQILSGGILFFFGIVTLFPSFWDKAEIKLGLSAGSGKLLQKSANRKGIAGSILIGFALGPVFASCSPTYAIVLAVIFPASFSAGVVNMLAYSLGLIVVMTLVALLGRRFLARIKWVADPHGIFRKILGVLFVILGLMIVTGLEKKLETALLDAGFLDITRIETTLLDNMREQTPTQPADESIFNVKAPYPAPELTGIAGWLNSEPLTLASLKGKVVLIDFWTYSCINCLRTLPYLKAWNEKYADDGLVIIGVHAPEFQFEKVLANVQRAVSENGIKYPVAQDNDYKTWNAFKNQYWPAKYFIDREGKVRHTHFGEGEYAESEEIIQELLKETGSRNLGEITTTDDKTPSGASQTPETYLGYQRGRNFSNAGQFIADTMVEYSALDNLQQHAWSLNGSWNIGKESSVSGSGESRLSLKFTAKDVYLVMSSDKTGTKVTVTVDNIKAKEAGYAGPNLDVNSQLLINSADLYHLVHSDTLLTGKTLTVIIPTGVNVYAFTFGS